MIEKDWVNEYIALECWRMYTEEKRKDEYWWSGKCECMVSGESVWKLQNV